MAKSPTKPARARKPRIGKRRRAGANASTKNDRELWAILLNTDDRKLALATRRLERTFVDGIRHFSALRRAVPLHLVDEVSREIRDLEADALGI
jgi:hypothetical protein